MNERRAPSPVELSDLPQHTYLRTRAVQHRERPARAHHDAPAKPARALPRRGAAPRQGGERLCAQRRLVSPRGNTVHRRGGGAPRTHLPPPRELLGLHRWWTAPTRRALMSPTLDGQRVQRRPPHLLTVIEHLPVTAPSFISVITPPPPPPPPSLLHLSHSARPPSIVIFLPPPTNTLPTLLTFIICPFRPSWWQSHPTHPVVPSAGWRRRRWSPPSTPSACELRLCSGVSLRLGSSRVLPRALPAGQLFRSSSLLFVLWPLRRRPLARRWPP